MNNKRQMGQTKKKGGGGGGGKYQAQRPPWHGGPTQQKQDNGNVGGGDGDEPVCLLSVCLSGCCLHFMSVYPACMSVLSVLSFLSFLYVSSGRSIYLFFRPACTPLSMCLSVCLLCYIHLSLCNSAILFSLLAALSVRPSVHLWLSVCLPACLVCCL
jgi:hypothetical protein